MSKKIISREFYLQDTRKVAEGLLGKLLVRQIEGKRMAGVIVETEAYRGFRDTACHAHKGPTERCKVMFGEGGNAYVYITYGIHNMLNFVTEKPFFPAAVLIRAIEPIEGIGEMIENRGIDDIANLTSGPGKLTKALDIDRDLSGISLLGDREVWVEEVGSAVVEWLDGYKLARSTRIGIDYADDWARNQRWRYFVEGNEHVSK